MSKKPNKPVPGKMDPKKAPFSKSSTTKTKSITHGASPGVVSMEEINAGPEYHRDKPQPHHVVRKIAHQSMSEKGANIDLCAANDLRPHHNSTDPQAYTEIDGAVLRSIGAVGHAVNPQLISVKGIEQVSSPFMHSTPNCDPQLALNSEANPFLVYPMRPNKSSDPRASPILPQSSRSQRNSRTNENPSVAHHSRRQSTSIIAEAFATAYTQDLSNTVSKRKHGDRTPDTNSLTKDLTTKKSCMITPPQVMDNELSPLNIRRVDFPNQLPMPQQQQSVADELLVELHRMMSELNTNQQHMSTKMDYLTAQYSTIGAKVKSAVDDAISEKFPALQRDINRRMDEAITKIENDVTNTVKDELVSTVKDEIDALESRLRDAERRKANLILYGVPESTAGTPELKKLDDSQKVASSIGNKNEITVKGAYRLGTHKEGTTRPIKVITGSGDQRNRALDLVKLSAPSSGDKITATKDFSREQRELHKKLKEEVKQRKAAGEENLEIRDYKIVKKPFRGYPQ